MLFAEGNGEWKNRAFRLRSECHDSILYQRTNALAFRCFASAILSPSVASRMKDILGPTSFQQVNLAGHAVMTDNPEGFAAAVLPFLTEISKNSK